MNRTIKLRLLARPTVPVSTAIRGSVFIMVVDCIGCGKSVDGKVVGTYTYHDAAEGPPCRITLLQCPRCEHAILVREEERWYDCWSNPETVYPCEGDTVHPDLPKHLRAIFAEAKSCYRARAYTASAIMCRKALEGICNEHGVKEKNLSASLKKMKNMDLIEGRLYEWADALRIVGNEAAHEVESNVSGEDARDLIEFTEALLDYVITFHERFIRFKERRKKKE